MVNDLDTLVKEVAEELNETESQPLEQIRQIVALCGPEFAHFMIENAHIIEEHGGMKTNDGSRDRTLGGIFFYIVRGSLPHKMRREVFPSKQERQKRQKARRKRRFPDFTWEDRKAILQKVLDNPGEVEEVNLSLKGRPGKVERREDVVIITMEQEPDEQIPRDLPPMPDEKTMFVVYIAATTWVKLEKQLKDSEDRQLVIDGPCTYDPEIGSIAVFARGVKTKNKKKPKPKPEPTAKEPEPLKPVSEMDPQEEGQNDADYLEQFSPEIAQKLRPLYGARRMFRKKLAEIEAKPEAEQSGLKMTQMMLERTEKQIEALENAAK